MQVVINSKIQCVIFVKNCNSIKKVKVKVLIWKRIKIILLTVCNVQWTLKMIKEEKYVNQMLKYLKRIFVQKYIFKKLIISN